MRDAMILALDVLGLLLVAAGLAAFLWTWIGASAMAPSGFLLLAASYYADRPLSAMRKHRAADQ